MEIGFIGAGRVGCSLGKYLSECGEQVNGYYDTETQLAEEAAVFTNSKGFHQIEELAAKSCLLFVTTPDGVIETVWKQLNQLPLEGKIICHCSGALASQDAFAGIQKIRAYGCSLHPMLPFSSRFSSYHQLKGAFFTVEGQQTAVDTVSNLFTALGNTVCQIPAECKPKYHAAASILSNQVIAVLHTGYQLLEQCGFTQAEAVQATKELVMQNIENVCQSGCVQALTGPIERGDRKTVQKHLHCLTQEDQEMYRVLSLKLVKLAEEKNADKDYGQMRILLKKGGEYD